MDITDADFELLSSNSMDLHSGPADRVDRDADYDRWPESDIEGAFFDPKRFRYLYAMYDHACTALAQVFLRDQGASFQTVCDEIGVPPCYVVFTDYASPCWLRKTSG